MTLLDEWRQAPESAVMAGRDSIRDTIAFPKSASAANLMDGSPSAVDDETLKELRIKLE